MLHMEYNPNLASWVETSPRPSPKLPVVLQLHKQTYVHLNITRPRLTLAANLSSAR